MKHTTTVIHPWQTPPATNPEQSHPTLSLRRVLWVKFLRWIDRTPLPSIWMACAKFLTLALFLCTLLAPSFVLGILTAGAQWNGYKIPMAIALVACVLNAKRFVRFARRFNVRRKRSHGNQNTYQGIPVDELASYLLEGRAFPTEAMKTLAIGQRKWARIAEELESKGVLVRGESNARVLSEITREELVRQLRDDFPLVHDPVTKAWVERRGSFDVWVLSKERREAKEQERRERLERKEEKTRRSIERMREEQASLALAGAA